MNIQLIIDQLLILKHTSPDIYNKLLRYLQEQKNTSLIPTIRENHKNKKALEKSIRELSTTY